MAASIHIPLHEYLHTTYRPDREYVDGELLERHLGKKEHARLQALLAMWFGNHEQAWNIIVFTGQRIQVSPNRVRIPDVTVVRPGPLPDVLVEPPLLAIEILSPDDSYSEMTRRCGDYQRMGIPTIWIIDPMNRTAHQSVDQTWRESAELRVPGTPIHVDLADLWQRLDQTGSVQQQQ